MVPRAGLGHVAARGRGVRVGHGRAAAGGLQRLPFVAGPGELGAQGDRLVGVAAEHQQGGGGGPGVLAPAVGRAEEARRSPAGQPVGGQGAGPGAQRRPRWPGRSAAARAGPPVPRDRWRRRPPPAVLGGPSGLACGVAPVCRPAGVAMAWRQQGQSAARRMLTRRQRHRPPDRRGPTAGRRAGPAASRRQQRGAGRRPAAARVGSNRVAVRVRPSGQPDRAAHQRGQRRRPARRGARRRVGAAPISARARLPRGGGSARRPSKRCPRARPPRWPRRRQEQRQPARQGLEGGQPIQALGHGVHRAARRACGAGGWPRRRRAARARWPGAARSRARWAGSPLPDRTVLAVPRRGRVRLSPRPRSWRDSSLSARAPSTWRTSATAGKRAKALRSDWARSAGSSSSR